MSRVHRLSATVSVALCCVAVCGAVLFHAAVDAAEPVRFNRDIRPILSSRCFACHGRDESNRKAGMRLDVRENALNAAESKAIPITPGKPESSEVIRRIFSTDRDEMMPPADSGKNLTATEKELLKGWVSEGAEYEPHWSLAPPLRVQSPIVKQTEWPRNPVDNFVLVRLEREGLRPSPAAEPATLLRRLCLDLTGLPAAAHDVATFDIELKTGDGNQRAAERVYEGWVDKLLASPHYGERMAEAAIIGVTMPPLGREQSAAAPIAQWLVRAAARTACLFAPRAGEIAG